MNFLLSEDLTQFRDVLRALLAKELSAAELRHSLLDPYSGEPLTPLPFLSGLWKKIADAGVLAAVLPERAGGVEIGGLELGTVALQVMLEESGRALVPLPIFETLVFGALPLLVLECDGADSTNRSEYLAALATGERRFTGAFFEAGAPLPRASVADSVTVLDGEAHFVSAFAQSTDLLLFAEQDGEVALFRIDPTQVAATVIPTLDLIRRFSTVHLSATPATRVGGGRLSSAAAARLAQLQQLACVAELAGVGARVLEMTVEYVKTRQQFGRPIGSFQAVQHKLADMLLRVEQTTSLGRFAAWAAESDPEQLAAAALAAKGFASEAIPLVAEQAIQAHGGIGFTYEYDLHLFLRRARSLAALGGSSESVYAQLGEQLLS